MLITLTVRKIFQVCFLNPEFPRLIPSNESSAMETALIVLASLAGVIIMTGAASLISIARKKKDPNDIDV